MRHLFIGNPMFAEIEREKRKALSKHNWRGGQLAARILLFSIYAFLISLSIRYPESIEPIGLLYIMLVIVLIVMPATMHGAIAGDRERRSLDLLLTAPVTAGQIVVGKLSRGVAILLAICITVGIPTLVVETMHWSGNPRTNFFFSDTYGFPGLFRAMLLVFVTGVFIASLSLWISSRTKTNASALLATIGALFALYVLLPMFAGLIGFMASDGSEFLMGVHPFIALGNTYMAQPQTPGGGQMVVTYSWFSVVGQIVAVYFLLSMARKNVWAVSKGRI